MAETLAQVGEWRRLGSDTWFFYEGGRCAGGIYARFMSSGEPLYHGERNDQEETFPSMAEAKEWVEGAAPADSPVGGSE